MKNEIIIIQYDHEKWINVLMRKNETTIIFFKLRKT
jgi:hypothetical protein